MCSSGMVRREIDLQPLYQGGHYDENDAMAQMDTGGPHPCRHTTHVDPIYKESRYSPGEEGGYGMIWTFGDGYLSGLR